MRKSSWLLLLLLVGTVSQFGKTIFLPSSFVLGLPIDYLAVKIYFVDILAIIFLFFHLNILQSQFKRTFPLFLIPAISGAVSLYHGTEPLLVLFLLFEVYVILTVFLVSSRLQIERKVIIRVVWGIGVFLTLLSTAQLLSQSSLQGVFYFLGERLRVPSMPGTAIVTIGDQKIMRPYATFSHPNALAGYLGLLSIYVLILEKKITKGSLGISGVLGLGIMGTFSKAVILILAGTSLFAKKHKYLIFVLLAVFLVVSQFHGDSESLSKRMDGYRQTAVLIGKTPLTGVGLGRHISVLAEASTTRIGVTGQPVHSAPFFILHELGIPLSLALLYFCFRYFKLRSPEYKYVLLFILLTGLFDHYWITSHQNSLLLAIFLGQLVKSSSPAEIP